ncbi:MAG: hypothetical protein KKG33_02735 [candidate division Zixibacteria bacterium]|nr:hypothetical protein [candidate division Zixibacteria bacterium]MBU1470568.1 hypothetical protein [candidate division Zixibacteria bacterium]MBU2624458.1 hypothetical protein [candidate division Zixibacteria bacterium]
MSKHTDEITLPASSELAEELIFLGLMQGREVMLSGAGDLQISEDLMNFAGRMGYCITYSDCNIEMISAGERRTDTETLQVADKRDFFRKMLVLARSQSDAHLAVPKDIDSDFESELILYKRMGFDYDLIERNGSRLCVPTRTETPNIKYRLPAKSYHLLDSIICGTIASGCSVELTSPVEVHPTPIMTLPDIGIELLLQKDEQVEDELARRLKRLRPSGKKKFRYTVQRHDITEPLRAILPGDHLPGLFVVGVGCIRSASGLIVRGFAKSETISAFCRMLGKMGAGITLRDSSAEASGGMCEIALSTLDLTGKRFGGSDIRSCPESFAVLATLGMLAAGKTVIRDLPFGSNLWRRRVGFVRDVLEQCGARIGEVEDGLVVEKGVDSMMMSWVETVDPYCDLFQQMLSIALPHHSSYCEPSHFKNSQLFHLYNVQPAETVR